MLLLRCRTIAVIESRERVTSSRSTCSTAVPPTRLAHRHAAQRGARGPQAVPVDPISPKGGFVGGGMQWLTDVAVDPAGNVWVANNWQDYNGCFGEASEAVLTRWGGNGLTVFYGMAKPVRAPQIGPARGYD